MITVVLVLIAFVWAVCSYFYQGAFRPYVHDSAKFDIFAMRDELRSLALQGEVDPQSFAFTHLEGMLNQMVHLCGWYSAAILFEAAFYKSRLDSESQAEFDRFDAEATPALKKLESRALRRMMEVMVLNSPGWITVATLFLFVTIISQTCAARWQQIKDLNRDIWHQNSNLMPAAK